MIMVDFLKYRTEPLTEDENATLTKVLKRSYLTGLTICCMATLLFVILMLVLANKISIEYILILISLDFLILLITRLTTKNLRLDITNGLKELREYQIINKISFFDDEPGLGGGPIMRYHLITKLKKFSVDMEFFEKANINDWIIDHEAPLTKEPLRLELK
jgi:hypothetical protein